MLTLDQIKELAEMVARLELGGVEVERSGFRVRIDGRPPAPVMAAPPAAPIATATAPPSPPPPAPSPGGSTASSSAEAGGAIDPDAEELPEGVELLPSPIVGTFYRAPSPEADPFVSIGDRVEVGQVLCIVEAMKLMNEIEADFAGVVVEIFAEDGKPVEYGSPLFAIRSA